jgi:flagellar biosynthesis protein FlhG
MLGQAERLYQLNGLFKENVLQTEGCKIISITSGKGGTGKSFLASNLAAELSNTGSKVLLLDLDLNFANLNVMFNASSKKTLYHYLTYNQNLEDLIYEYSQNLHLVLGESGKIDHPKFNEERANILIEELRILSENYDVIILDTASGADQGTIQLLINSDELILVTTPEPTSVMDAYVIFKLLKSNGSRVIKNVVINKCFKDGEAEEAFGNLEKATNHFLKTDINYLGELSFSEEIVKSIKAQNPIVDTKNSLKISRQFTSIINKLRIPTSG